MFSANENFIVPESSLVLPRWQKKPKDYRYKVVYDFNVYNRPVGCMLHMAEIKVTAFAHIRTLTSNTKSYKSCYIILLFWNSFAKPLSDK